MTLAYNQFLKMVKYLVVVTILAKVVQKCKFLQKSFFYFFEVVFFFRSDLSYVCKSAVIFFSSLFCLICFWELLFRVRSRSIFCVKFLRSFYLFSLSVLYNAKSSSNNIKLFMKLISE